MYYNIYFQVLSQVSPKPDEVVRTVALQHQRKNRSDNFLPRKLYHNHTLLHYHAFKLVCPARPIPPLLFTILSFICEGKGLATFQCGHELL